MARISKQSPAFQTRDDMKAQQLAALIAVLQAPNPAYNITRHEVQALGRILNRWNIPVAAIGANQLTGGPAAVNIRDMAELIELGVPDEAPLYYQIAINGEWHEAAPLLGNLRASDFNTVTFNEIWNDLQAANPTKAEAAIMNVDGRAIGETVRLALVNITSQELAKIPA